MTDLDELREFLETMRSRHEEQVDALQLPDGTEELIAQLIREGDQETLVFMLKLGYLMGLQAGLAIASGEADDDDGGPPPPQGPLEA